MKSRVLLVFLLFGVKFVFPGKLVTPESYEKLIENIEGVRDKRFVPFLKLYQEDDTASTTTTTPSDPAELIVTSTQPTPEVIPCFSPDGGAGHCTFITSCFIKSFAAAPLTIYKYFCLMGTNYLGICCPNEEPKIQNIKVKPNSGNKDPDVLEENGNNNIETVVFRENSEENIDPETRGCGVNNPGSTKIVGGHPARIREWPWMAALMKGAGSHWDRFCGGALITDRHVLTAAHCLAGDSNREIRVRLGEYDFANTNEVQTKDFKVVEIRKHSGFKDATMYKDDIAIIKLHRPTSFNDDVWPICLPPTDSTFEDQPATVIGWGTQAYGGPVSDVLLQAEISVWRQSECEEAFKRSLPLATLCAGERKGRKDSCQGDSGGPLMSQLKSGRWSLVGVVSWGIRCGELNKPGLYTRVNQYLDWIVENSVF